MPAQNLTNYSAVQTDLRRLIDSWKTPNDEIEAMRKFRKITRNPEKLRKQKKLAKDETLIIIRTIDNNIRRIKPQWLAYITDSRRIVEVVDNNAGGRASLGAKRIEADYSRGLRNGGAIKSFSQQIDACMLFGRTYADVVFDSSKPLHFSVDYVASDKLIYERHCEDIQDSKWVLRRFDMTLASLEELSKKLSFNKEVVDTILEKLRQSVGDEGLKDSPCSIYKGYVKIKGVTHIFHYTPDHGASDWLKAPQPLYIGLDDEVTSDVFLQEPTVTFERREIDYFPIFTLEYETTEDEKLVNSVGRGHIDTPIQEAETVLASSGVTRANRASKIFFSTTEATEKGMTASQDILEDGKVYNQPLRAMTLPPGTGEGLAMWQALRSVSAQNAGAIDTSFQDKRTARTTATEVQNAQQQTAAQSGLGLLNLAYHVRAISELGLEIAISQAKQERIKFAFDAEEQLNNQEILNGDYSVYPAGDADSAQRKETLATMKEFWPMVSQTPASHDFLARMIELGLPNAEAEEFAAMIREANRIQAIIGQLTQALDKAVDDEERSALPPQDQQALQQLLAQGAQLAGFGEQG